MKLNHITITGADNSVSPKDLLEISRAYPFVEWGILFSPKRVGINRYPSMEWIKELYKCVDGEEIRLSAHLCGGYTAEMLTGSTRMLYDNLGDLMGLFDRVQLNFNATRNIAYDGFYDLILRRLSNQNFIIQYNKSNEIVCKKIIDSKLKNISFLYDASGGRGTTSNSYQAPIDGFFCGYAGGLSPDNVHVEMIKINKISGQSPIWIDTESGVRSFDDEQFDLDKVVKFLDLAMQWID